ncbi:hypothetical protein SAMN05444266_111109 [Chitinophaga jiangningensis]|uniref:Uncharacterized protein n=1 Tax=Chitinophaga jiangningensis TaxID=1419482 RepID=A0A1M7LRN2_9BACT|nr:hypothetical protein [Chitinophaga jiangningensis]SHM80943.1 hypothetical protein SAMN05444266_111109 [Chitinophaga jiangningensis]
MMTVEQFKQSGVPLPALTHQRVQELKQTPKGQHIMMQPFAAFPAMLESLTNGLQDKLLSFEWGQISQTTRQEGLTLEGLKEDYQFLEFVQFIMFVKYTEENRRKKAS